MAALSFLRAPLVSMAKKDDAPLASPSVSTNPALLQRHFVWNLAIGSNMDPNKLQTRRPKDRPAIEPIGPGVPAIAENWELSFDLMAVPPLEPAMAAAVPKKGQQLHGVLYKLSKESYETLAYTEGVVDATSVYREEEVEVTVYPGFVGGENSVPERVRAVVFGLRYPPETALRDRFILPSKRYHDLMVGSAKKAGLDKGYVDKLESHPSAGVLDGWERTMAERLWGAAVFCFMRKRLKFAYRNHYKPGLVALYSRRERARWEGHVMRERFWKIMFAMYMAPMVLIDLVRTYLLRVPSPPLLK